MTSCRWPPVVSLRCASAIIAAKMSGVRFDYRNEQQRHEKFVGRAALLARLDQLTITGGANRWVVITGDLGMSKSALLTEWLVQHDVDLPRLLVRKGIRVEVVALAADDHEG